MIIKKKFNGIKRLRFTHITRTAGTTIEDVGFDNRLYWGRHDPVYAAKIGHWHKPLSDLELPKLETLLEEFEFFTIVRNPYDRIISELYWYCPPVTSEELNIGIQTILEGLPRENFHCCPQHLYTHLNDKQICKYIIKFEDLEKDFPLLMEKYGRSIKIDRHLSKSERLLQLDDLSVAVRKIISNIYNLDFKLFNYKT